MYHFRLHSLRHTRAKEYVEQGIGISVIQQILGHQSLQMTVHYATVSDNILYEKWKNAQYLSILEQTLQKVKELKQENRKLKEQLEVLRRKIYEIKLKS
ncbi:tyrosine-type recombinase/integrase [Clostridium sp. M14]|uniref:tyrosine-type recombinase/integrase n=1 Tax=Clostridium sp. M14 TaxID=2716311 RepID=UPI00398D4483